MEFEYQIIEITIKKNESITFTDEYRIVQILSARQGSMNDDTWYLTVLIETERLDEDESDDD